MILYADSVGEVPDAANEVNTDFRKTNSNKSHLFV
jgi:hypothetical protein